MTSILTEQSIFLLGEISVRFNFEFVSFNISIFLNFQTYFNNTGSSFCWYNIDREGFKDGSGNKDTCPNLPIQQQ